MKEENSYLGVKTEREKLREEYIKECEEFIEKQRGLWKAKIGYVPFDEYFIYGFRKAIENLRKKRKEEALLSAGEETEKGIKRL